MTRLALLHRIAYAFAALGIATAPVTDAGARAVPPADQARRTPPQRKLDGKRPRPHGLRECARRRRQIAAGILTASNGYVRNA